MKKELKNLLSSGETETIEFKGNPNESFYKTISAFANTKGGRILLGIDKNGNLKGVDESRIQCILGGFDQSHCEQTIPIS